MRWAFLLLAIIGLAACKRDQKADVVDAGAPTGPQLIDVGPRLVSNQTAYPLSLYGRGLTDGMTAVFLGDQRHELKTQRVSADELTLLLPPEVMRTSDRSRESFDLQIELRDAQGKWIEGNAHITIVNDEGFFDPQVIELGANESQVFISAKHTDALITLDRKTGALGRVPVGDGPVGLARWAKGKETFVVVSHESDPSLLVMRADKVEDRFQVAMPPRSRGVTVLGDKAYVSNQLEDVVFEVDLVKQSLERKIPVGVNPGAITVAGPGRLAVGHHGSDDASIVDLSDAREHRLVPAPGLPIVGGHTEKYSPYIMGGKVPRALVGDAKRHVVFAGSLGPNIGPNPDRMEVSMNGGISVIDLEGPRFVRHVSLLRGVPEALALDERRGLLYVADLATGRVVVMAADALVKDDESARKAILGALELSPPAETQLVRPAEDFGVQGRSGVSIHTGPTDLRLVDGGKTLLVLCRFTRELLELDLSEAAKGLLKEKRRHRLDPGADQSLRRSGQVLFFTDLGNSRMTCDTCHPSGHVGGLLFTKGRPIRIYRSPSIRGARESPPFFTPTKLESLYDMSRQVLARNRYENPVPTSFEKKALTLYATLMPTPPNPYRAEGGIPKTLSLPDGRVGRPKDGRGVFYGKGGCADLRCHPPPHFTADQDPKTRGLLHHVGTPLALGLRAEMQDMDPDYGWPAAALIGTWDYFPLLMSGAGGFDTTPEGVLEARHPFAMRRVIEGPLARSHGGMAALSDAERDDLLAFLLTL